MKTKNKNRLSKLGKAIDRRPLHRTSIEDAFERFRETGELPEQQRLADAVTKKALDPNWDAVTESDPFIVYLLATQTRIDVRSEAAEPTLTKPRPSAVLKNLYGEAVWGPEPVREIARKALIWHSDAGTDVASPDWLANRKMPRFGTVGFMLLGYPDFLAVPPYEQQAQRLFVRYGDLLEKKGPCDEHWERRFDQASLAFYRRGELPTDPLLRDVVLGGTEIDALFEHHRGGNVKELMAALDAAALASGDEREAAIKDIVAVIQRTDVEIVGRIS